MKTQLALITALTLSTTQLISLEKQDLKDTHTKRSYSLGANYGKLLNQRQIDIDLNTFFAGFKDGLANEPLLTETEIQTQIQALSDELKNRAAQQRQQLAQTNQQQSQTFLTNNAKQKDITTLPSGLQYKILHQGPGPKPTIQDKVKVHYRGTLIDGTQFDSSYDRGTPAEFSLTGVIQGWTQALQLMPTGSKWQLFIPPNLAYGERGSRNQIGPNAALIFEIELLEILPPPTPKTTPTNQPISSDIIKVPSAAELEKGAEIEIIKAEDVQKYIKKEATQKDTSTNQKQ